MASVLFAGLSTIDIVYEVDEFPAANTKICAHSQSVYAGGPAANAAIACAHLGREATGSEVMGGEVTLVTAVGRNALAAVIREDLARYSVQLVDLNPDFDGAPAISSVSVDKRGHRNVVSANAVRIPVPAARVNLDLAKQARILMVDGHYMQACQAWAAAAHACGTPVVLDGGSWKDGMGELLKSVDTAICSADFSPPGCDGTDDVIRFLRDAGVRNIAISNGAAPIEVVAAESTATVSVPQLQVVDTMGAGDILHGAYCFYAAQGLGFVDALTAAARIAAASCRYAGTREWMKHSPAVLPFGLGDRSASKTFAA
jgi:sugar/nucleoside kinase (ribokinase family)